MNRAFRAPVVALLLAAFSIPPLYAGDADPFNAARFEPTLDATSPSAFRFARQVKAIDAGTHKKNAFSHFHFHKRAELAQAFDQVEKRNVIDVKQVAQQLTKARKASVAGMPTIAARTNDDASRRVAAAVDLKTSDAPIVLAYATPNTDEESKPLAAIAAVAPLAQEMEELASLPDSAPVPTLRPKFKPEVVQEDEPDKPGERVVTEKPAKPEKDKPQDKPKAVATVRPENPDRQGFGQSLRNIFGGGGKRAGNGVAVYDISAAKVYMPDGTVLRAHSGIGKMADNPKYVHVKMNGPTPPHTYNLRMRERRFHGVEAIRMLPVDGKNKYGRDGFLTHSQLLRGRPNQSHGCVAFADYDKFLRAFKQGKVKQMIVVPSGGSAIARRSGGGAGA